MSNILIELLEEFPDKPWDWNKISANPNISLEYIENHPDLPWNKNGLTKNPNFTIDFLLKHLKNYKFSGNWSSSDISSNPGITIKDITDHPELQWSNDCICRYNPNTPLDFILKYNFSDCGGTKNITLDMINSYPNVFKNKSVISRNPNLTLQYVFDHSNEISNKWNWIEIGSNPNVFITDLKEYSREIITRVNIRDRDDFLRGICKNQNICFQDIMTGDICRRIFNNNYSTLNMIRNPNITMDELISLDKHIIYDDEEIMYSQNVTKEIILKNADKNSTWKIISENEFLYNVPKPIIIRV